MLLAKNLPTGKALCLLLWYALCVPAFTMANHPATCFTETEPQTECSAKEKYCVGTKLFKDGGIYEGEFKYGKPHGYGKMTWPGGDVYEGDFQKGLRHGEGVQTYADGSIYSGNFRLGFMDGIGTYKWSDGAIYAGGFQKNKFEGHGWFTTSDGERYEGGWKKGLADGEGNYMLVDGSRYLGHYKKGKRHGSGIISWTTGEQLLGQWKQGQLDGAASILFDNGHELVMQWSNGRAGNGWTYQVQQQPRWTGSLEQLREAGTKISADKRAFIWYVIGIENKLAKKYNEALEAFQMAQHGTPASSDLGKLIHSQTQLIQKKLQISGS